MAPRDVTAQPVQDPGEPVPGWRRPLGRTGLVVSAVTAGTSGVGAAAAEASRSGEPDEVAERVGAERDLATLRAVLDGPVTVLDTSNNYTGGWSERRIGQALRETGGLPDGRLVISKVDPEGGDFSAARARASLEETLTRLGLDRIPLVHLHDPDHLDFDHVAGPGGALAGLVAMREEGLVDAVGLAGGSVPEIRRYLDLGLFDVLLVHNRWTLVDRSAGSLLEAAAAQGVALVNAAVYGGGLLAAEAGERTTYAYRPAQPQLLEAVERMRQVCAEHGTDLATAALQFSVRDERFATTVVGMTRSERVPAVVAAAATPLPEELWPALEALTPPPEVWVDPPA